MPIFAANTLIMFYTLLQKKLLHIRTGILLFFSVLVFACSKTPIQTNTSLKNESQELETVISVDAISIADSSISSASLEKALLSYTFSDSAALDSSIKDYSYKLQLFQAAKDKGYDKDPIILDEIETYKRLLAEETIVDSLLLEDMINEAYNHLQFELKASHLFISLPTAALSKDTAFVYKELLRIRSEAIASSNFDSLVQLYSQDRRTSKEGGSLGWFSGLQMVYSIEKAAFALEVGEISNPVRSDQGYHLIYLEDKRKSRGRVQVRHLLKSVPNEADSSFVASTKLEMDSLLLIARDSPSTFTSLIKDNSDDFNSRDHGGLLPPISTGSRVEEPFENTAFSLDSTEISNVVRTSVGFHILQLVDKKDNKSLADSYDMIKQKVTTDSRGEFLTRQSLEKVASTIGFQQVLQVPEGISTLFNKSLLQSEWVYKVEAKDKVLLKFDSGSIPLSQFLKFVEDRQQYDPVDENTSVDVAIFKYFQLFKQQTLKELAVIHMFQSSKKLQQQIELIKRDLVCTKYVNQTLLEKAVADTLGQRRWYNANLELFKKEPRAYATIIQCNNTSTADSLLNSYEETLPYRLKRGIKPIYFSKNFYFLKDDDKRRLTGLFAILQKNPNYIVEIGGHRDVAEEAYVSTSRISEVVNYLRDLGLEITRVKEADYAQTKLADRFDWNQNQRVSIQFFSNDFLDLIPTFSKSNEDIVKVQRKWFTNQEAPYLWDYVGKAGVVDTGETTSFVMVKRIEEPGYYSIREVRGRVINEYQLQLETELKAKLNLKYPIKLNPDEINRLKKSLLKKI